jgi:hypothetical protein
MAASVLLAMAAIFLDEQIGHLQIVGSSQRSNSN